MPTSKTKALSLGRTKELSCASTENWRSHFTIWNKQLKYSSVYFTWESHSNIKNFLVTFCFAIFSFTSIFSSDEISLIKWTSRCLFTCRLDVTRLTHCDWSIRRQKASLALHHKALHYLQFSGSLKIFTVCLNLALLCDAAASPPSHFRSAASHVGKDNNYSSRFRRNARLGFAFVIFLTIFFILRLPQNAVTL